MFLLYFREAHLRSDNGIKLIPASRLFSAEMPDSFKGFHFVVVFVVREDPDNGVLLTPLSHNNKKHTRKRVRLAAKIQSYYTRELFLICYFFYIFSRWVSKKIIENCCTFDWQTWMKKIVDVVRCTLNYVRQSSQFHLLKFSEQRFLNQMINNRPRDHKLCLCYLSTCTK